MSSRSLRPARKIGVAVLSASLGLAGLGLAAAPVAADTIDAVEDDCGRLSGQTRFGTAGAIANAYTDESPTTTAILASGRDRNFPDALAASGLAREIDAPILLTNPDSVPDETRSALDTEGITDIVIVGGTDAVSAAVAADLDANYNVRRVAGTDRFKTAEAIAMEIGEPGELDGLRTALIATGFNYPDALAGGPVAYHGDGTNPFPILLTARDSVPADTIQALEALNIEQVIILGGTSAVSAAVETELEDQTGNDARRLQGTNREGTARDIADFAVRELGFAPEAVLLADGYLRRPSPDALTGGPLGGVEMAPILLVNNGNSQMMPAVTEAFISENADAIVQVIALGGPVAVSQETLEAGCEAGGVPVPGNNTATFDANSVQAGDTLTGTLTGDFASATIAGDCIEGGTVTVNAEDDTDPNTDGVQFEVATARNATAGDCEITVTFFDADGNEIDRVTVTIEITERPNAAATTRPELIDAEIVSTTTQEQATANGTQPGTVVRFTFDEEITGVQGVNEALFHIYDQDGTQFDGVADESTIETSGNSVLIRFAEIDTATLAADITLATVDFGAVFDNEGEENPIGDAPLGTSGETTTGFVAGRTDAPDLLSVGDFRSTTTNDPNTPEDDRLFTTVTFTFDEAAFTVDPAGFFLVSVNGDLIPCTAVEGQAGGQPETAQETGDTTIDVTCEETTFGRDITAADIARGVVEVDTVSDERQVSNAPAAEVPEGNTNPLQASDTPDAATTEPDLVSAELRLDQNATAGNPDGVDQIVFTFDEAVLLVSSDAAVAGAQFFAYDVDGNQIPGINAQRGTDPTQVIVTFTDATIDRTVGASVEQDAVVGQTGTANRTNEPDEEGVENTQTTTDAQTAGRTDNPDLIEVRIEDNATTGQAQVVYVFDEDVQLVDRNGEFFLVQADGTRLVCADDNATVGPNETATTNPDRDNEVTCTRFTVADPTTGGATADVATSAQVREAVVGTVDDDAVIGETDTLETNVDPTTGGDTGFGNPEGAELATGSTGTPRQ